MKPTAPIRYAVTACALALTATVPALAGDIQIIAIGAVTSVSPNPMGFPLAGLSPGATFEATVDVFDLPVAQGAGTAYPIDRAGCAVRIGSHSFVPGALPQPMVQVEDGLPDSLAFGFVVQSPTTFNVSLSMIDLSGARFTTTDLSQLGGTYPMGGTLISTSLVGALVGTPFLVGVALSEVRIVAAGQCTPVGASYCQAAPNSSGLAGRIRACGSDRIVANDVTLLASALPTTTFGFFITSRTPGFVAQPAGSAGNLCLAGPIGRFQSSIQTTTNGEYSRRIDLGALPTPSGTVVAQPGERWYFQSWFRDSSSGTATSNFTDAIGIQFH